MSKHIELAKGFYNAFAMADREFVENILAPHFVFSAPPDPMLDRNGFFEVCWAGGAGKLRDYDFVRLIEEGNEVVVTYEVTKPDGVRCRNTEVIVFDDDKVVRSEVYFGWDIK